MNAAVYLPSATLFLLFAYWTFRRIVRLNYLEDGKLSLVSSLLQLLVFGAYFAFPSLFSTPNWYLIWQPHGEQGPILYYSALLLTGLGVLVAFGTMGWFGLRKAFGLHTGRLLKNGPYRFSRNPQIIGGFFLVGGVFLQRPSWFMLGWVAMYVILAHWMIITEEEHLTQIFGAEYKAYCAGVPRYILGI